MKILYVEPNENTMYSFRRELVDSLIDDGHEVYIMLAFGKRIEKDYIDKTSGLFNVDANLRSINILKNIKLVKTYKKVIKTIKPDVLLTFTIKPNLYCNSFKHNAYSIANITGLGTAFNKKGVINRIIIHLYKKSFINVDHIMFQNKPNYNIFEKNNIPINNYSLIPGSGVNINKFFFKPPQNHNFYTFLFASRFVKEKGIQVLIDAIPNLLKLTNAHFLFVGEDHNGYGEKIKKLIKQYPNNIKWMSRTNSMVDIYHQADFVVSPSFYKEGISNVLLESLSCGRPIITTNDNPGCMELIKENINGFSVKSNNLDSLLAALKKACNISREDFFKMCNNCRDTVANNYNRDLVVSEYLRIINHINK